MSAHSVRSAIKGALVPPTPVITQTTANATAPASSVTGTFGSNVRPGNLVIVIAGEGAENTSNPSCSGGSQTWRPFYVVTKNCLGAGYWTIATSSFTTVTVSWPSSQYTGIQMFEVANMGQHPHIYGTGFTTAWGSRSIWMPANTLAMYHVYMAGGGGNSWSQSGWSLIGGGSNGWNDVFYKITTVDGDVNCPWGGNGGSNPANSIFGFSPSGL